MGFYLISKEGDKPFAIFVDKIDDLIYQVEGDLNDVIITEGSKDNPPFFLKDSPEFKNLCDERYRIGIQAQNLFRKTAKDNLFMVESIPQDQSSFADYNVIDSISVKRADYVIKNCKDIEVDVKCLTYYKVGKELCFYIKYKEIKSLERMNSLIAKNTVLAIYNQKEKKVIEDSLIMIELSTILKENNKAVRYDKEKKCMIVPIRLATSGIQILEDYKINKEAYLLNKKE